MGQISMRAAMGPSGAAPAKDAANVSASLCDDLPILGSPRLMTLPCYQARSVCLPIPLCDIFLICSLDHQID